jgi:hypothetical protein
VLVLLWRGAAVVCLGIASLSAASLSAAAEATGPAVALGADAAVLCAAGLATALTAHRPARLTVAAVTAAQLLAVAAARHLGGLPAEHSGHGGHETRLLCGGAAAVARWPCSHGSTTATPTSRARRADSVPGRRTAIACRPPGQA